ncbi:MAG: TatD family nuclease-associated radical SAM protein [Oscillospiraceae bacterium]|nr:TatD family nuclease-associated radical SAM protein [Oscillospiraceae bacterium]
MADIIYTFNGKPYFNLTNRCPCACVFCLRATQAGVGSAASLWHEKDPTWEEIEQALENFVFSEVSDAVFCGYGEPLCALDNLLRTASWLKERYPGISLRVDTNGLGDLVHGCPTAPLLKGLIDTVSISLNAPNAVRYQELTCSQFGEASYPAMLRFAAQCKNNEIIPRVIFSVVDVITPEETQQCREIARGMGIALRVRKKS